MTPRAHLVEWVDSAHIEPGAWVERDQATEVTPCGVLTVAWLLVDDDDRVVLAGHLTEQGHASGVFVIPKSCVVRLEPLSPVGLSRTPSPPSRGWRSLLPFGGE